MRHGDKCQQFRRAGLRIVRMGVLNDKSRRKGRQGTGCVTWSLTSRSPKLEAMSWAPHNQSSKVLAETGAPRTTKTLGWAVPFAPSVLHSTEILQPHQQPVQVPGEQGLLHQAED